MEERKRKLYIITQNYPYGDGEKTFIEPELKRLCETERWDITIISTAVKGSELTAKVPCDVRVINIPVVTRKDGLSRVYLEMKYGLSYFFSKNSACEFYAFKKIGFTLGRLLDSVIEYIQANIFYYDMMQMKLDLNESVIYTYWCHIETLAIALHKDELSDVKLISRIHRFDLYDEQNIHGRQPFRKMMDEKLDKLYFIAQAGLEYYVRRIGADSRDKYVLSRLGTECTESYDQIRINQRQTNRFVLVSCSSLIPVKCVEIIIQALQLLEKEEIDWIHFGDGCSRQELEEMALKLLGNKKNIKFDFKGRTKNEEILSFYKEYLVGSFVTTSRSEGCPVSIQEAMSFGLPIIATAVGEIPFMIQGNGILLSESPSPKEVADAIGRIYSEPPEKINVMRKKSRDLWEQYFNAEENYRFFIGQIMNL